MKTGLDKSSDEKAVPTENFGLLVPVKKGKGGLPPVILILMRKLDGFISDPELFPNLFDKKPPNIQKRHAIVLVLKSLLLRCDLMTLRIGFPTARGFRDTNLQRIMDDTGLDKRRINRVFQYLDYLNLVSRTRQWNCKQGSDEQPTFSGRPSRRFINPYIFSMFGLKQELSRQRLKKQRLQYKRNLKSQNENSQHAIATALKQLLSKQKQGIRNKKSNQQANVQNILGQKKNDGLIPDNLSREYSRLAVKHYANLKKQGFQENEIREYIMKLALENIPETDPDQFGQ